MHLQIPEQLLQSHITSATVRWNLEPELGWNFLRCRELETSPTEQFLQPKEHRRIEIAKHSYGHQKASQISVSLSSTLVQKNHFPCGVRPKPSDKDAA